MLKRGLGASIAGARPAKGTEPIVVGIIVEVLGKKRVFMPMTRVRSIDASQIISTGLVNLRRFEQRNSETLIVGELFDRRVRLLDGSGDAVIEDVAIEQRRNGDWGSLNCLFPASTPAPAPGAAGPKKLSSSTGTRLCSRPTWSRRRPPRSWPTTKTQARRPCGRHPRDER